MKKWLTYMVLLLCVGHVWGQTYHVGDLFTAPDGSQGIVYYLNPDGSGGWVVALTDASTGCYWDWGDPSDIPGLQNYTSDYPQILLSDTSGYQNTQTIRNFLNDPYSAAGIVDFDNGWVLPSPAQLRMLYAQLPFVSAALEAAGGADMADAFYWTSAEKDAYFAWSVAFATGFSGYFHANSKGSTFCHVRAVRSFTYEPTYVWSTGDTGSTITVSPEQTTAYAVTASTLIGCSDTADQTVTVLHYDTTHLYETVCDGYLWYGDSLVQSGEYPHTLTATTGCDSVVTLHLTVNHSTDQTLPLTILENDLPYPFLDTTFYEAGSYELMLTNMAGCDSMLTVVLTVLANVTDTVDSMICESALPFVWNGVEFTQAGTLPALLTAANGADSVVLMTVIVIPTTYGTFDTAVVENALPYHFHSLTCDSAGVYVDTLENAVGCDSVLTLNLTVWPNVTATDYDTVCESELPFTWNDSIFTAAGTKMTTIQAHTGADSTVTMILEVIPTTYGTFDTTVVQNALPFHYHNLTCDSAGVYTDTLENEAGCDSILTLNLSVWPNVTFEMDSAVCIDAFPVIWNDSILTEAGTKMTTILAHTGADSTITMTVTVIPTTYGTLDTTVVENALPWHLHNLVCDSAGVYTDTITNAAGCDSVLTVNLMVWPNVTSELDSAVCEGDFPFTWNDSVFLGADVKMTTIPAHTGADSTITMTVTVIPTTYGTFDTAVVENALPWHFHNLVCDSAGVYTDTLVSAAGCDSILTLHLTVFYNVSNQVDTTICNSELPFNWNGVVFTAAGTDSVTLAAATGADSVVVMTVQVYPVTQYHIAGPGVICADSSVTLTADSAVSYIWSTGETTQSITVDSVGYYSVSVTDGNGCTFTVDHYVRGIFDPIIEVNVDTIMCMGGTYTVTVGYQQGSSILLGDRVTTLSMTDTVFLPDGFPCEPYGCSYQSPLTFTAYAPGDTIESVDDIYYVRLNMEHSWIGDLYINITCPNGQKADLLKFGGFGTTECNASIQPSSQGWQAGANMQMNAFLGFAHDYSVNTCDANAFGNEPGVGWNYCWSENTTQGYTYAPGEGSLIYRSPNQHYGIVDSSNVAAGTHFYHPDDPFSNLIGCPLNGSWYIEVMDGWGEDNGYIFGWELALSSEALPEATFTFDHSTVEGPWATAVSDSVFIIQPPADLDHDTTIVYVFTVYDTSGCSVDTAVAITFLSSVFTEKDTAVCLSFQWNGVTYTASGEYQQTFVNANGCDSVVTMHLTVNLPDDTTIYASTVQNSLPYHYVNGQIDTTFGVGIPMLTTSQFIFPNSNGCDSVVTLILTVYQNVATTVDTTVCAASLPYTWHGHTFTAAGSHPVTLLTSHGADSVVTYHLSVDNLAVTVGNVTHVNCYGASTGAATVTATGGQTPLTCQWTNAAGTTVSTSSAISNRPAGTYTFTVTDHLGCTATATVTINTLNGELVPGTIAASQEVCDGEDIAPFTGSAASGGDNGHYQWQISTNGADWTNAPGTSTAQGYTYPNTATSAFTLRRAWVSQSCGTVYSNEVTVSVWPNSSDTITASVCQGEAYQDNGFNVTADETAEAGMFTYEQHHATGHCDSAVILLLTVNPVSAELVEASVCEGEGYDENGFSVLPQETIGESELTRTLNLQSGQGCDSTVTLHLSVIDTSSRLVMLTEDFCEHQEASLSAVSPMPDYVWSTGETATTIVVTSPGLYSVTASEGGCSATASIRVEACHYELVLPNAITPSRGDGLNDSFYIPESFTGNINFFKIYIYNRWGELVFHSTDKNFRWSGEYRGQTQIQTVYNYVIEYTDMVGRPHKMVGTVTVL